MHITTDFSEIAPEFARRVSAMVYCTLATVDGGGRPRSRVIHPIWDGATGWFMSQPRTAKIAQLRRNPAASLAYIAEPFTAVYVECRALVQDDPASRQHAWELFRRTPPPYGVDLSEVWGHVDSPDYLLLRLDPWRIELYDLLNQQNRMVWQLGATYESVPPVSSD